MINDKKMGANEWSCHKCTFLHKLNGTRCSMCGELRTSRDQMRQFVLGKNSDDKGGGSNAPSAAKMNPNRSTDQTKILPTACSKGTVASTSSVINPYTKKKLRISETHTDNQMNRNRVSNHPHAMANPEPRRSHPQAQLQSKSKAQNNHNSSSVSTGTFRNNNLSPMIGQNSTDSKTDEASVPPPSLPPRNPYANLNRNQKSQLPHKSTQPHQSTTTTQQHNSHAQQQHNSHDYQHTIQKEASVREKYNPLPHKNISHTNQSHEPQQPQSSIRQQPPVVPLNLPQHQIPNNPTIVNTTNHNAKNTVGSKRKTGPNAATPNPTTLPPNTTPTSTHSTTKKPKRQRTLPFTPSTQRQQTLPFLPTQPQPPQPPQPPPRPYPNYTPGPIPLAPNPIPQTWLYPHSHTYTERDYQLSISKSAILQNTLVSLPTGLGKTLIAAVVMYNFYRWFPSGIVLFLAPTRPLVSQQIEACYNVVGIPERDTAEMSGRSRPMDRMELWKERRIFFCTPQTCQKDIEEGRVDAQRIVCIVLDEAHKALGKYAYTNVINLVEKAGARFRIVGLSATPGKDLENVKKVLGNLRISKIDSRSEDDPDVKKYVHDRQIEVVKVEPSTKGAVVDKLLGKVLNPLIDMLHKRNALMRFRGNYDTLSSYSVMLSMKECQKRNDNSLISHFLTLQALLRAREALRENGIGLARTKLLSFMKSQGHKGFGQTIAKSNDYLTVWNAIIDAQDTGKNPEQRIPEDFKMNNPKLQKLDEVLNEHFQRTRACGRSSRAIVFSQWRDSVEEIVNVLNGPGLVKARKFVGQSSGLSAMEAEDGAESSTTRKKTSKVAGMNQKEQQRIIKEFRLGIYNVLVCTCIGEEGLDIGEVDLIVNYDSLRSPIRMIQRTGRTGRKRDGRVVCLVYKGNEERKLEKSKADTRTLWRALKNSSLAFNFYKNVPLLPQEPILEKKNMEAISAYRQSQIGGHATKKKKNFKRKMFKKHIESNEWKLSAHQRKECLQLFGNMNHFEEYTTRKYIKAWKTSIMAGIKCGNRDWLRAGGSGNSCNILRAMKRKCFQDYSSLSSKESQSRQQTLEQNNNAPSTDSENDNGVPFVFEDDDNDALSNKSSIGHEGCINRVDHSSISNDCNLDLIFGKARPETVTNEGSNSRQITGIVFDMKDRVALVTPPPRLDLALGIYTVNDGESSVTSENEETCSEHSDKDDGTSICSDEISIKQAEAEELCDFFAPVPNCQDQTYEVEKSDSQVKESIVVEDLNFNCGENDSIDSQVKRDVTEREVLRLNEKSPDIQVCDREIENVMSLPIAKKPDSGSTNQSSFADEKDATLFDNRNMSNAYNQHVVVCDEELESGLVSTTEKFTDSGSTNICKEVCDKNKEANVLLTTNLQSNGKNYHDEVETIISSECPESKRNSEDVCDKKTEANVLQTIDLQSNEKNYHDKVETRAISVPSKMYSTKSNERNSEENEVPKEGIFPFHATEGDEVEQSVVIFGGLQLPSQLEDSSVSTIGEDKELLENTVATEVEEACDAPPKLKKQTSTQSESGLVPKISMQEAYFARPASNLPEDSVLRSSQECVLYRNSTRNENFNDQKRNDTCNGLVENHSTPEKNLILEASKFCLPSQDSSSSSDPSSDSDSNSSQSIHLGNISISMINDSVDSHSNRESDRYIPKNQIECNIQKTNSNILKNEVAVAQSDSLLNNGAMTVEISLKNETVKADVDEEDVSIKSGQMSNLKEAVCINADINSVEENQIRSNALVTEPKSVVLSEEILLSQQIDARVNGLASISPPSPQVLRSIIHANRGEPHNSPHNDLTDTPEKLPVRSPHVLHPIIHTEKGEQHDSPLNDLTDTPEVDRGMELIKPHDVLSKKETRNNSPLDNLTDTPEVDRGVKKKTRNNSSLDDLTDTPEVDRGVKLLNSNNVSSKKKTRRKRLRRGKAKLRSSDSRPLREDNDPALCPFLDLEAEDNIEESDETDYSQDSSHNSFINDTSQLGYTQDELDFAEMNDNFKPCDQESTLDHDGTFYRSIDNGQAVTDSFSTPVLNRRQNRKACTPQNLAEIQTQQSVASSDKSLGNMNFIRSVIEHHRRGGDAAEIENEYHRLGRDKALSLNNNDIVKNKDIVNHSIINPRMHTQRKPFPKKENILTNEQKARIEINRQKAMKIREAKLNAKKTKEY